MMKIVSLPFLAVFCLAVPTVSAAEADEYDPSIPHAFDAGWKGQKTCEVLYEDETTRVGRCVFPPGVGHELHYHNPHFGYVLEGGDLLIRDGEGEKEVTTVAGGTWSTDVRTEHQAVNIGDTTTSYLIVEPKSP